MLNKLKEKAIKQNIDIDYVSFEGDRKVDHIGIYGLKILRIDKSIKGTIEEIQVLLKADEEFKNIHKDIKTESLKKDKPKSWNQFARENHIRELENRGIEPTQKNIDKLIDEIYEIIGGGLCEH